MALVVDVAPFCILCDVQLKHGGGLCDAAFKTVCNYYVFVLAAHFVSFSFAVMDHLCAQILPLLSVPLTKAFMAQATLGMSSDRICLVCFSPSRRCWCPFSLFRRRVMCAVFTTMSSLLAHAPRSPRQKKTKEVMDDIHARKSMFLV